MLGLMGCELISRCQCWALVNQRKAFMPGQEYNRLLFVHFNHHYTHKDKLHGH